jgi:GNAT superfamily N-acetyltransferase
VDVRPLRPEDDRAAFRSGDPDLDRFFHKYAGQNQFRHHLGSTLVAVEVSRIVGFATVSAGHLESDQAEELRLPRDPLPILRLARLAVDASIRGRGAGEALLKSVFGLALRMSTDYGCVGVVVDAKPESRGFYEKYGFKAKAAVGGALHSVPRPLPMLLPISVLKRAEW